MKNIRIIGVHHRYQMSIADVEDAIVDFKPDIVAVELPEDDYLKFLEVHSYLETEMKIAMVTGCEFGAMVFLIDMKKEDVFRDLKEILGIEDRKLWDEFEKGDIPAFYRRVLEISPSHLKKVKKVLLKHREEVMATNILILAEKYPRSRILAVVGYSHRKVVEELVKAREFSIKTEPFFLDCEEILAYN